MNTKERLAGAVVVLTLAVGIIVDLLETKAKDVVVPSSLQAWSVTGPAAGAPCWVAEGADTAAGESQPGGLGDTAAGGSPSQAPEGSFRRLDLNRASEEELMLLPGIGPKKAGAVVAWREAHGRFGSIEALLEVKGIGEVTLERLRPYICVGN